MHPTETFSSASKRHGGTGRVTSLFSPWSYWPVFVAFAVGFSSAMATSVIVAFVIGCVLLAPSIIIGYAVKAAERDDRERGY